MDKTFICLGNSYKHGNRCIAGIEIELHLERKTYSVIRDENGNPIWIRPINRYTEAGAIPNDEAAGISICDIVKACDVEHHPEGAQKENYYYSRLIRVSKMTNSTNNLDCLVDGYHRYLFGNRGVAVHPDNYVNLDYSLMLVKSTSIEFYMKNRSQWEKDPQPRGKLTVNGNEYDLPVTDPVFRKLIQDDQDKANSYSIYYITLSLGVEHDEWHSKLIAGIIPMNAK